ncbi:MAG: hypothetical protein AAF564_21135 [Bacteroidota bacterium]
MAMDLDDRVLVMQNGKTPRRFIYTSHGWSASNWLAFALNLHPDIVCSHSARNMLADKKNMNSNANLKAHLAQLHKGYVSRQERSFDAAYAEIEDMGTAVMYGSVHVYRLRDLPVVFKKFGQPADAYNVLNLVRHPVSLVWSGYGQFKDLFRYDLNELHWTSGKVLREGGSFLYDLAAEYDLNIGELDNLAFLGACAVLGSLRLDLNALPHLAEMPGITFHGHTCMEQVTTAPAVLATAIQTLSDDTLVADETYLDAVYEAGVINEHKKDRNKFDASARFDQFFDWQVAAFKFFFSKYNLQPAYEALGYNFDFLKN